MPNYIVQTYSRGEDLTNLLVNKVILEIEKETKNHKTNIQVINNSNFIVVRGNTTHKTPINLSKLFISYYKTLFSSDINLNVVDLIEYDAPVEEESIYFKKTYTKDELSDSIKKQTYLDTLNNKHYRFTACTDLNIVFTTKSKRILSLWPHTVPCLKAITENLSSDKCITPFSPCNFEIPYG